MTDKNKSQNSRSYKLFYVWGALLSFLMIMTIMIVVVVLPVIKQHDESREVAVGYSATGYIPDGQNPFTAPGRNKPIVEKPVEIDSTLAKGKKLEEQVVFLTKENEKQKIQLDSIWNEMVKLAKEIQPSKQITKDEEILDIAEIDKNIVELKYELEQVRKQILQREAEIWTLKQIYQSKK